MLYVGKAKDLKHRISSYFTKSRDLGEKTKALLSQVASIKTIPVDSELESLLLEANYIKKHKPKYNIRLTDGKSYPLLRITIKDSYPKILLARKDVDPASLYFGPYPNTSELRLVLRTIRQIFPFISSKNHKRKACFYHHLNLCPCPTVFDSPQEQKAYKKTIRHVVDFLQGKKEKVVKDLKRERDNASKRQEFEKAKEVQEKIDAIYAITSPVRKPFEYEVNPNLRIDLRSRELNQLKTELAKHGVLIEILHRIECYDISNLQGRSASGSMIVFIDGERTSSLYRRFRIRAENGQPNDVLMMREVLERRLKHPEWELPNLIIVDGGKGQISQAQEALKHNKLEIPVVGLAKRNETVITALFEEINLPRNSHALHLLQRIRDEAHRFALAYHKKLRSSLILTSA